MPVIGMNFFIIGGLLLIVAFLIGKLTHWLKITAVVGYLLTGIVLGPEVIGVVDFTPHQIETITWFGLGFVGFNIGGKLPISLLRKSGKKVMLIMAGGMIAPFVLVMIGVTIFKADISLGLLFGALACSSAPAGVLAVIYEYGARGKLTDTIITVVGLDDVFGVAIFAITLAGVSTLIGGTNDFLTFSTLMGPLKEIVGGLLLGVVLGGILAFAVKKMHHRIELFVIAIGLILSCVGLSVLPRLGFSVILATIAMGMTFVNIIPHESRIVFKDLDRVALPVFMVFFVTAGMELKLDMLLGIGSIFLVLLYVLLRSAGKITGPMICARISKADKNIERYLGLGILPQAGVALGLALLASHKLEQLGHPETAQLVITTIAATTIIFEIIGPIGARFALIRSGEATKK